MCGGVTVVTGLDPPKPSLELTREHFLSRNFYTGGGENLVGVKVVTSGAGTQFLDDPLAPGSYWGYLFSYQIGMFEFQKKL